MDRGGADNVADDDASGIRRTAFKDICEFVEKLDRSRRRSRAVDCYEETHHCRITDEHGKNLECLVIRKRNSLNSEM